MRVYCDAGSLIKKRLKKYAKKHKNNLFNKNTYVYVFSLQKFLHDQTLSPKNIF